MTPHSQLHYRVFDHSTFRKDSVIGEKKLNLFDVLSHYNGKCENLELTVDLMGESKHETHQVKVGELITLLDGMKIDMSSFSQSHMGDGFPRVNNSSPSLIRKYMKLC